MKGSIKGGLPEVTLVAEQTQEMKPVKGWPRSATPFSHSLYTYATETL